MVALKYIGALIHMGASSSTDGCSGGPRTAKSYRLLARDPLVGLPCCPCACTTLVAELMLHSSAPCFSAVQHSPSPSLPRWPRTRSLRLLFSSLFTPLILPACHFHPSSPLPTSEVRGRPSPHPALSRYRIQPITFRIHIDAISLDFSVSENASGRTLALSPSSNPPDRS